MTLDKPRINARSIPVVLEIDRHIRQCNIRGPLDRFRDAAADPLDGAVFRCELRDLIVRGMLVVVHYGFDDSMGRDPDRARDQSLCGTSWSVNPSAKMIRTFWPDRFHPIAKGRRQRQ